MSRNYDKESGMNRVKMTDPEDATTRIARLDIVEKPHLDDKQRPIFDRSATSQTQSTDTSRQLEPRTIRDKESDPKSAKSAHFRVAPQYTLLTAFDVFGIARPRLRLINEFTPSTFELYNLLHGMHESLNGNTRINNYFAEYFSLASRIYYGYLAIFQILRARLASGRPLDPVHRRVFKKLETTLPLESCPVASPLVGWFQNLGAHHLSDATYDWIVPALPPMTPATPLAVPAGNMFHFPPIPVMVAFFRAIAFAANTARKYQNAQGYVIPVDSTADAAARLFLGQAWSLNADIPFPVPLQIAFAQPGLSFPLVEQSDYFTRTRCTYWRRLNLPDVNPATATHTWEHFLLMEGTANLDWLRIMRNYATAESRFFRGSVNLAQISPVTGLNTTVIGQSDRPPLAPELPRIYETAYSGYDHVPTSYHALSGLIDDIELRFGGTHRLIICPTPASTFHVPAGFPHPQQTIIGPFFRDADPNEQYVGRLRDRWHIETSVSKDISNDVRSLILAHLYEPMGTDPEPVRLA